MEGIFGVDDAARELLRIHDYSLAGRTTLEDVNRVGELIRYIKKNGDDYCGAIRDAYVKQGFRVKAGDQVAVKDDNGNVVALEFIAPFQIQYLVSSKS